MSRTFAYSRCSTSEQNTENQFLDIESQGYNVEPHRQVSEIVSGGVCAFQRPQFAKLVEKLEAGDILVVSKIDRLGRDNIDVQQTILKLSDMGIKVVSLDLPTDDLTSPNGKLMIQMFSAFAEFEKARIQERTMDGLARAKAEGKTLGRRKGSNAYNDVQAYRAKNPNHTQSDTAKALGKSIATIKRHWNKVA